MDPATVVMTAMSAGAVQGVRESATSAVKDSYQALKHLLSSRFSGQREAELALREYAKDPQVWQASLRAAVVETGAANDEKVIEAAQRLMNLLDEIGARSGKYSIDLKGAKGVQVNQSGGNVQYNTFR